MYLAPDGDESAIAEAAAEYLAGAMPIARLHEHGTSSLSDDLRRSVGEMGWFALALPEADGGSGLSAVEHALFFREVGRQCGPVDILAQSLAAMTAGDDALRPDLLAGSSSVALAVADGDNLRLLGASDAAYAVHVTRDEARLIAVDDTSANTRDSLDPATPMRLLPSASATVVAATTGDRVWAMGELGTAAMLIGVAEAALDLIVDYAKIRETFGRKIGSYQAVRHPCADMALRVEAARSQLWFAAAAMKEGRTDAGLHLDAAKHLANQAAIANADTNIQLHGGIGVTDEHHAHLFLKHALVLGKLFGAKRALFGRLLNAEAIA